MREILVAQMKEAMKAGDKVRVGALRLMMAALKDREIEMRGTGKIVSRADELALFTKMVKSRQESMTIYQQAGRQELADQESAEIAIISEFLPKQMDLAAKPDGAKIVQLSRAAPQFCLAGSAGVAGAGVAAGAAGGTGAV
jgi:uncharacterized protein YqeY